MKTLPKITWITYLIIGMMLNSCTDQKPENDKIYFLYTNKTNENVELKMFDKNNVNFRNFKIFANSTTQIDLKQSGGKGIGIPFLFNDGTYC